MSTFGCLGVFFGGDSLWQDLLPESGRQTPPLTISYYSQYRLFQVQPARELLLCFVVFGRRAYGGPTGVPRGAGGSNYRLSSRLERSFLFLITFQGSLDRIVGSIFFFFRAQLDFLGWCFAQTLISLFPDLFPAASAALVVGGPRSHVY